MFRPREPLSRMQPRRSYISYSHLSVENRANTIVTHGYSQIDDFYSSQVARLGRRAMAEIPDNGAIVLVANTYKWTCVAHFLSQRLSWATAVMCNLLDGYEVLNDYYEFGFGTIKD